MIQAPADRDRVRQDFIHPVRGSSPSGRDRQQMPVRVLKLRPQGRVETAGPWCPRPPGPVGPSGIAVGLSGRPADPGLPAASKRHGQQVRQQTLQSDLQKPSHSAASHCAVARAQTASSRANQSSLHSARRAIISPRIKGRRHTDAAPIPRVSDSEFSRYRGRSCPFINHISDRACLRSGWRPYMDRPKGGHRVTPPVPDRRHGQSSEASEGRSALRCRSKSPRMLYQIRQPIGLPRR